MDRPPADRLADVLPGASPGCAVGLRAACRCALRVVAVGGALLAACADATAVGSASEVGRAAAEGDARSALEASPTASAGTQRLVLAVEGMVCESCENAIRGAVSPLPGVKSCSSSHQAGRAEIDYDPARITPEKLASVIQGLGYRVSPASGGGPAPSSSPAPSAAGPAGAPAAGAAPAEPGAEATAVTGAEPIAGQ